MFSMFWSVTPSLRCLHVELNVLFLQGRTHFELSRLEINQIVLFTMCTISVLIG